MWETILRLDTEWLLAINRLHQPWLDPVMILISEKLVWVPLYGWLSWITIQKLGWKTGLYALIGLVIAITLSDQSASAWLKPMFHRLRPCHEPSLKSLLYLPIGCGGQFGFVSSHAANAFCVAIYFNLLLISWSRLLLWLILWAVVICLSRVYLSGLTIRVMCWGVL